MATASPVRLKPATDIMIDLETAGTEANAAILTIGMVDFSLAGDSYESATRAEFYVRVVPESYDQCAPHLFSVSFSTMKWWMRSVSEGARAEAWPDARDTNAVSVLTAIRKAHVWLKERCDNKTRVWAQGIDFDMRILSHAFKTAKLDVPWHFAKQVDLRTYFTLKGTTLRQAGQRGGNSHSAIEDCRNQVSALLGTWHVSQMSKATASAGQSDPGRTLYNFKNAGVGKKKR